MSHFRERRAGTEIGAGHPAALDRPVVAGRRMPRGTKAAGATPGSAELRRSQRGTHAVPTRRFPSHRALPHAQEAALGAIANVLIMHLEEERERSTHASAPSGERLCLGATRDLTELLNAVAPGPTLAKRLRTAYCVQRTAQLLGGHPIDDDSDAVHRLGLWTILNLRWPLLAEHLARYPDHVRLLQRQQSPTGISDDLEQVFTDPEAARLTIGWPGAEIGPENVRRFSSAPREYGPLPQR